MPLPALFCIALVSLIVAAGRFGRSPERLVAGALAANFVLTTCNHLLQGPLTFTTADPTTMLVDFATLVAVMAIALRANRTWPLPIASLQMFVMIAHASVMLTRGWNQVYWGMMALSQLCQLIVLAIGIGSNAVRERRRGPCRSWRKPAPTIGSRPPDFRQVGEEQLVVRAQEPRLVARLELQAR